VPGEKEVAYTLAPQRGNKSQSVSIVSQMAAVFFIDGIKRSLRRRAREKKLAAAKNWPTAQGEVNHWQVLNADEDVATTGTPYQIEAGFHFKLNGEYYGGYLRSVAMTHHEAETQSKGEPKVNVRYNPANPDETAVFAEDNSDSLPFKVVSG
jgi:Protein of unknown function (DUF3592)